MDLGKFSEEDKAKMNAMIHQLEVRDSLKMYNALTQRCFTQCVSSFTSKRLSKQEAVCVDKCAQKFLKHSMRVGMRFAELNQGAATPDNPSP